MVTLNLTRVHFKDLISILKVDLFCNSPKGEHFEQIRTSYIGYKAISARLGKMMSLLVSYDLRKQISSIAHCLFRRVIEMRSFLLNRSMHRYLELTNTLTHLRMDPESIEWTSPVSKFPLIFGSSRLEFLIDTFSKSGMLIHECSVPDSLIIKMTEEEAKSIILRNELGRRDLLLGRRLEQQRRRMKASEIVLDLDTAVTRISAMYRMYICRKRFREERDREYVFLRLVAPKALPEKVMMADKIVKQRTALAQRLEESWNKKQEEEVHRIETEAKIDLERNFSQDVRMKIWQFRQQTGQFPESIEHLLGLVPLDKPGTAEGDKSRPDKKKPPPKDKPKEPSPPIPVMDTTKEPLMQMLTEFSKTRKFDYVENPSEKYEKLKMEKIAELNKELARIKKNSGLSDTVVPAPTVTPCFDEQDTIDLIKMGVLVSIKPEYLSCYIGDKYSCPLNGSIAHIKTVIVEDCILPLILNERRPELKHTSVLLYGPPGCGKSLLARIIATESRSKFFDLSPSVLKNISMNPAEFIDQVFRVAKHHSPSVICIDGIHELLASSPPLTKKKKKPTDTANIGKFRADILSLMERARMEQIVVISTTNATNETLTRNKAIFQLKILVNIPSFLDRVYIVKHVVINERSGYIDPVVVEVVAKMLDYIPTVEILRLMRFILTKWRCENLKKFPLTSKEFIDGISRLKVIRDDWALFDSQMKAQDEQAAKSQKKIKKSS